MLNQLDIKGDAGGENVLLRKLEFERLTVAWMKCCVLGYEPAHSCGAGISDGTTASMEPEKNKGSQQNETSVKTSSTSSPGRKNNLY